VAKKEYAMQSLISSHEKLTTLKKEIAKLEAGKRDLSTSEKGTSHP
jgi:BMFP domain-containing protein YqiC